jgi:predicted anti-sigma-YlaC factor YlaD
MTMWNTHVSGELAAYVDGELTGRAARHMGRHLGQCARCRTDCDRVRSSMAMMERLPSVEAPAAIWAAIEAGLREPRSYRLPAIRSWRLAFAATVLVALAGAASWRLTHPPGTRWEVRRIEGAPAVSARAIAGVGQVGAGDWIETDSGSRARVTIGEIGSVEIAPNTRVRVLATRPDDHRLALARGEIRAAISAPPRLFFVDTASGTAVDLGCEYTLQTGEDGVGLLRVSRGWVSFQWNSLESLVPAGASCQTRPQAGPGLPYFDDAPDAMKGALARFGLEKGEGGLIDIILAEARVRDTLTLWHLMWRVDLSERGRVYDRIAALTPIPAGVSREKALALDRETLTHWREELAWTW